MGAKQFIKRTQGKINQRVFNKIVSLHRDGADLEACLAVIDSMAYSRSSRRLWVAQFVNYLLQQERNQQLDLLDEVVTNQANHAQHLKED